MCWQFGSDPGKREQKSTSLQWLQALAVPIVVAVVGGSYTYFSTQAQIRSAEAAALVERKVKLVDSVAAHLKDEDPTIALALLDILSVVDPASASSIRVRAGEPDTGEPTAPEKGGISPAFRAAVRAGVPIPGAIPPGESGAWYAVIAAFRTWEDARQSAFDAFQRMGKGFPVVVYLSRNGLYVVTAGGALLNEEQARNNVDVARKVGEPGKFELAYAWEAARWTEVFRVKVGER
jgi:hypothetical protein